MSRLILAFLAFALVSCTDGFTTFPVTESAQQSTDENVTIIRLDEVNIADFGTPARGPQRSSLGASSSWDYRIGTGDLLDIIVFDHPELTLPAGPLATSPSAGYSVQADGTFFYPFIGQVEARGRSVQAIRADISERLAEFIPDPQVEVRIVQFNSQGVNVTGEVRTPNRQQLDTVGLTLLEAISAAGGTTPEADLTRVSLQRGGKVNIVDLKAFTENGFTENNPLLRDGDIVNVPRRRIAEVYVLGEIARPGIVDVSIEQVNLTQTITRLGGTNGPRADARGVFVFRIIDGRMTVFQLDTATPVGLLLGTRFLLQSGDVVYVTRSPLQRW
ncbi:MAG: polysaccharide biosynthesis/export family protein, partial [Paracoccaceae bacterium]